MSKQFVGKREFPVMVVLENNINDLGETFADGVTVHPYAKVPTKDPAWGNRLSFCNGGRELFETLIPKGHNGEPVKAHVTVQYFAGKIPTGTKRKMNSRKQGVVKFPAKFERYSDPGNRSYVTNYIFTPAGEMDLEGRWATLTGFNKLPNDTIVHGIVTIERV